MCRVTSWCSALIALGVIFSPAEASIGETASRPWTNQMRNAAAMKPLFRRDAGVWPQTRSLLYKNLLIKWRTKQQSLQVRLDEVVYVSLV